MKLVLLLLVTILSGCISFTTTEKQVMSPLYQVESKDYQDIRGNFTVHSFLLYKKISLATNESFTIDRWNTSTGIFYTASARYLGGSWRFMETIHIKIDDELFSFSDPSPRRDVLEGRAGMVEELVRVELPAGVLASLRESSSLGIQFYAGPVTIPSEGIVALRDFLRQ